MLKALALARRGEGHVEPNPMVGAVILNQHGRLVGMGYHTKFGHAHAEIEALREAGPQAQGGTLYVTLEPCSHYGKTPPCVLAILTAGLRRVVVAHPDPFPAVAGQGLAQLRAAGCNVEVGVAQSEAESLLAPYLSRVVAKRPWIIGKWAMTSDGKIATHTGDSRWISSAASRIRVHELRGRVDAILVGGETLRRDDATLTARPESIRKRLATRVIFTRSGAIPPRGALWSTRAEAPIRFVGPAESRAALQPWLDAGATWEELNPQGGVQAWQALLSRWATAGWTNVLVEAGPGLMGDIQDQVGLDEVWAFMAPTVLGGRAAPGPIGGQGLAVLQSARVPAFQKVVAVGPDAWLRVVYRWRAPERRLPPDTGA